MTMRMPLRSTARLAIAALTGLLAVVPARAQMPGGLPIIRDTEIENLLRDYARPLFRVANVGGSQTNVIIVNSRAFNAFVANGRRIFINAGAILDSRSPNELIGVMAHETGHIAGGHLARLREAVERAQVIAAIGMLVGAAGVAAGAASGGARSSGVGEAAPGAITAGAQIGMRSLLSYQRGEEAAADRAAITYLNATGQSAKGMVETFRRLHNESMFIARHVDPYAVSHPMPADRIAIIEPLAKASPHYNRTDPPALDARHQLARAKLAGFLDRSDAIVRRYPPSDTSLPARYARTIQMFRFGDRNRAAAMADDLIRSQPNNPYFHEIKGQILLETGQPAAAIPALRRAVALAPNSGLIRIMLGHALVASGNNAVLEEAIRELRLALQNEPEAGDGYRQLAIAYGRKNDRGQADLAAAQAAYHSGDVQTARGLARRAQGSLPTGSPGWLIAEDIFNQRQRRN
ncbi:M48 family metalloprotease [Phreatobacter oligotrophus]|uniref:M48 family metalloprotease n=1 Tax=Phreatobacter oligotrophus TaxID=1122261 RepID=UPI002354DBB6|nr:M48 family metalloprotease [Phreatobacter oligotrophus]MBX9989120.1 M48 family metalloprotease [Phreatobacter oligotrophus]